MQREGNINKDEHTKNIRLFLYMNKRTTLMIHYNPIIINMI